MISKIIFAMEKDSYNQITFPGGRVIQIFDGTGFQQWKRRMNLILKAEGVWGIVSGQEPAPDVKNKQAFDA